MKTNKNDKLEAILPEIESGVSVLNAKNKPEAFKARNFIGVSLMNKGKLKEALQ